VQVNRPALSNGFVNAAVPALTKRGLLAAIALDHLVEHLVAEWQSERTIVPSSHAKLGVETFKASTAGYRW
jgi:hypothetical protein